MSKKRVVDFDGQTKIWRENGRVSVGLSGADLPSGLRLSTAIDSEVGKALNTYLGASALDEIGEYSVPEGYSLEAKGESVLIRAPWGYIDLTDNEPVAAGFAATAHGAEGQVPADVTVIDMIYLAKLIQEIASVMGWNFDRIDVFGWAHLRAMVDLLLEKDVTALIPVGSAEVKSKRPAQKPNRVLLGQDSKGQLWAYLAKNHLDKSKVNDDHLDSLLFVRDVLRRSGLDAKALVTTTEWDVPGAVKRRTGSDIYVLHTSSSYLTLVLPDGITLDAELDTNEQILVNAKRARMFTLRRRTEEGQQVCDGAERTLFLDAASVGLSFYGLPVTMDDESVDPLERARIVLEEADGKTAAELVAALAEAGLIRR